MRQGYPHSPNGEAGTTGNGEYTRAYLGQMALIHQPFQPSSDPFNISGDPWALAECDDNIPDIDAPTQLTNQAQSWINHGPIVERRSG
jgi:hypothetical protein